MLNLTGDILNWLTAGAMFPLMFLPLALLLGERRRPIIAWIVGVFVLVAAGVAFARLAPILSIAPAPPQLAVFAAVSGALVLLVAATGGVLKTVNRLTPVFDNIVRITARAVMWLLLAMAVIQFGVVVLRYVFGVNFIFMQESITYMHGAVFLLAGGYALLTDDHVRVDIFYGSAPPKKKALIDLLGTYFLLFPVCLILLWTASPYVANSWAVGEGSTETSGIQAVFLIKSFIPAFAVLMAMAGFNIAARAGDVLKGRG